MSRKASTAVRWFLLSWERLTLWLAGTEDDKSTRNKWGPGALEPLSGVASSLGPSCCTMCLRASINRTLRNRSGEKGSCRGRSGHCVLFNSSVLLCWSALIACAACANSTIFPFSKLSLSAAVSCYEELEREMLLLPHFFFLRFYIFKALFSLFLLIH